MSSPKVIVAGAGVGGLALHLALARVGVESTLYEQAPQFTHAGADLNLTPNAVLALGGLGVGDRLRADAARPTFRISRTWDTGEETSRLPMSSEAEAKYGAPQLTMHRADVVDALVGSVPAERLAFDKRVASIAAGDESIEVGFTDGTTTSGAIVIGADGIHSVVRESAFGAEVPIYTGIVAYRAVVPVERLPQLDNLDAFTKWWGADPATQLVVFPLRRGREIFLFATAAQEEWSEESWTARGDMAELRRHYEGFHPDARALFDACDEVLKSALRVRDPLPRWWGDRIVLLGDACHPMMPFMAQGAAMAIEDAVVLARCLEGVELADGAAINLALDRYQRTRHERASTVQLMSRDNNWLRSAGDAGWLYGYDAWTTPLAEPESR